jgi:hypothetical protein
MCKRPATHTGWCALALAAVAGCGRIAFDPINENGDGGNASDSSLDAVGCTSFGPWSAPQRITQLATTQREYVGQLMPDHLTLYFTRGSQQYVARRPDRGSPFGLPQLISELGSGCCSTLRRDELELYFESDRAGTVCIFQSTRTSTTATWSTPAMVPALCGSATEGAYLTPDGLTLYFNTAMPPTDSLGTLMVTTRASTSSTFGPGAPVAGLSGGATKGYPTLSVDGLAIRFESLGPTDLFEATRPSPGAAFGTPAAISGINTTAAEQDNVVSEDGLELFFGSDRITANDLDLYVASRSCL